MPLSGSTKQRVCGSQLFWRVRTCCGSAPVQGWFWLWPSRPCPPALGRALCALPSSPWAPPTDTPDTSASSRALSCQRALTSASHPRPNQVSFSLPAAVWEYCKVHYGNAETCRHWSVLSVFICYCLGTLRVLGVQCDLNCSLQCQ